MLLIRRHARWFVLSLTLALGTASTAIAVQSCASAPSSVVTPQGKAAFSADQFVSALGVFQDAVIQANSQTPPLISTADTRLIVTFCKSAATTAASVPAGWSATVQTGLTQLKASLSPAALAKYGNYVTILQTILGGIS